MIAKDENLDKDEDVVTPLDVVGKPSWKAPSYQSFCLNVQEEGPGKYKGRGRKAKEGKKDQTNQNMILNLT